MIEENSDEISGTDEGAEDTSDAMSNSNPESLLESLEPFPEDALNASPEMEEEAVPAAEKRRAKRRRQRMIEDLANIYGLDDEDAIQTMTLIDELLPERARMSTAKHVGQRLELAMKGLKDRHPRLLFTREGKGLDVTDPSRYFYPTGAFAKLLDDEEGILRAIIVNRRARAGAERMAREHDAVEELLLTEYVRRSTLVEQWRYLLPKYMLPFFSMMEAAGVKADQARVDTALFNRIRDVIVEWSGGMVSREDIMSAARRTEEEFLHALKDDDPSETRKPVEESFDEYRERLRLALQEARADLAGLDDLGAEENDISEARIRVDHLMRAISIDAGMDAAGRLVFPSLGTFMEAIAARSRAGRGIVTEDFGHADQDGFVADEDAVTLVANVSLDGAVEDGGDDDVTRAREHVVDADVDNLVDVAIDPTGDVYAQAEVLNGPSAEDYGPDIPDDLFGPEALVADDDDPDGKGSPGPSDDDHSFADAGTVAGSGGGLEDGASRKEEGGEVLPPVGEGAPAFDLSGVTNWPSENMEVRRIAPGLARSTGLSRSTFDRPFTMWRPSTEPPPFCFMGFRLQPDISARQGREGPIEPVDLSRLEIGDGQWKAATVPGCSRILGQSHPLMLPPHSRLSWYGRRLGWSELDIRSLDDFGSPAKPETVAPKGDGGKLADAMRGVAAMRLAELVQRVPGHFLADTGVGAERRAEAVEDLARYWIFVLLARHDQANFDQMFIDGFFQGIHGPDFVVDAAGAADFGAADRGGHIGIFSPNLIRKLPPVVTGEPFRGAIGAGVVSGMRRQAV
ncbi:hypothetical protein [Qipengyuania sp.]|uniref:hypothetical protein n=1 Tax=Qipengyuania sp. TaxID=2004515 RepID=UPI003AF554AD